MRLLICYAVFEPAARYFSFRNALAEPGQTAGGWFLSKQDETPGWVFVSATEVSDEEATKLEEEGV